MQLQRGHFESVFKGNGCSEAAWKPGLPGTAALLGLPEGLRMTLQTAVILTEDLEISAI